jgi:hypothetical protein
MATRATTVTTVTMATTATRVTRATTGMVTTPATTATTVTMATTTGTRGMATRGMATRGMATRGMATRVMATRVMATRVMVTRVMATRARETKGATRAITATGTIRATAIITAGSANLPAVAGFRAFRRTGTLGLALTAWDIWRRIPKQHRRALVRQGRKYGPILAAKLIAQQQRRRDRN